MNPIAIVKVSGKELDDPIFLDSLCMALAHLDRPIILVHGGGKEISAAMEHYGQTVQFIDGLRVTPPESMDVMEMVVSGRINKRIVAKLIAAGKRALGISGVDLGLLRCMPYRPGGIDLQRVGIVTTVDTDILYTLLELNWLPVLAPVALGQDDGLPYNVNADYVAQAVAAALTPTHQQTELVFVSNVPGVIIADHVAEHLTADQIERGIDDGFITDGMIPKVRSALTALEAGVACVRITNLEGLAYGGTSIVSPL